MEFWIAKCDEIEYIILFGLYMEYLGPSMTPPASHVISKNEIFGQKMASSSEIRLKHIDRLRQMSRDLNNN